MPRIYVIGALVYDLVFNIPDWVAPNLAVHATQVTLSPGGKSLNQAAAIRRLGGDASLVGCVGKDLFGREMIRALQEIGVDVEHVRELDDARTSLSSILVLDNMPGFIGAPEASRRISEGDIRHALQGLDSDDIVLIDFEVPQPLVPLALEIGRDAGATTVLNPAPFFTNDCFEVDYLDLVDVLIPNKLESQLLVDGVSENAEDLARRLLARGIKQVVMTLGESGSLYLDANILDRAADIFGSDAVDTTGASDAFVGAFCLGLHRHWDIRRTMAFASATAALACSRHGTMTALPALEDVDALLAANGA